MTDVAEALLKRLRDLPESERAAVVDYLYENLHEGHAHDSIASERVIAEASERYPVLFANTETSRLRSVLGLGLGNHPAPTDAEVSQWVAEHRMEKYGS